MDQNILVSLLCCFVTAYAASPLLWPMSQTSANCGHQAVEDIAFSNVGVSKSLVSDYGETGRVIGGRVSKYGAHPWQIHIISIKPDPPYQCSGAIVSEYFFVTAAHCLARQRIGNYRVKAGDYDKTKVDQYEEDFEIQSVALHDNYQKKTVYDNDLAVVKIKPKNGRGFNFQNSYVHPICLPGHFTAPYQSRCLVAGWGQVNVSASNPASFPTVLHHASVPVIAQSTCKILYQSLTEVGNGMLCAGFLKGGVDTCGGDSGGPLVCQVEGKFVLFGLVSWGDGCAEQQRPGVYTRIQHYISWIHAKMTQMSLDSNSQGTKPDEIIFGSVINT